MLEYQAMYGFVISVDQTNKVISNKQTKRKTNK